MIFRRPELAAQWFVLPYLYDNERAPNEWRWGENDLEANFLLSQRLRVAANPARLWTWPHSHERMPAKYSPIFITACFPDDPQDIAAVGAKSIAVSGMYKAVVEFLSNVTNICAPVSDAARIPALSEGEWYFVPAQYKAYMGWTIANDPSFPLDGDGRLERFETLANAPVSRDPEWTATVVGAGLEAFVLSREVAREVVRALYGPLVK